MRNSRRRQTKRTTTSPSPKVVMVTDEELRQRAVTLEDQYPDIAMFADPDCGQCCGTTAFAQAYGWDRARDLGMKGAGSRRAAEPPTDQFGASPRSDVL